VFASSAWHFEHIGPEDWTSIPRIFADHGWITVGTGKLWHNPGGPGSPEVQFPDTINVTGRRYFPVRLLMRRLAFFFFIVKDIVEN